MKVHYFLYTLIIVLSSQSFYLHEQLLHSTAHKAKLIKYRMFYIINSKKLENGPVRPK